MSMNPTEIKKLANEIDIMSLNHKRAAVDHLLDKYKWSKISDENRQKMHEELDRKINGYGEAGKLTCNVCGLFSGCNSFDVRVEHPDEDVKWYYHHEDKNVQKIIDDINIDVQRMIDVLWSFPSIDELKEIFAYIDRWKTQIRCV